MSTDAGLCCCFFLLLFLFDTVGCATGRASGL